MDLALGHKGHAKGLMNQIAQIILESDAHGMEQHAMETALHSLKKDCAQVINVNGLHHPAMELQIVIL